MGDVVAAKRLAFPTPFTAVDASEVASAIASLRSAHRVLGSFLDQIGPGPPPPASVVGSGDGDGDDPMGEYEAVMVEEADLPGDVGEVAEGTAGCGMQYKRRRKRPMPSCWPPGITDDRDVAAASSVDRRRSAMDLVFQFHG